MISKKSMEGMAWFLLTVYSKMWEEIDTLRKQLLNKKELALSDLKNS